MISDPLQIHSLQLVPIGPEWCQMAFKSFGGKTVGQVHGLLLCASTGQGWNDKEDSRTRHLKHISTGPEKSFPVTWDHITYLTKTSAHDHRNLNPVNPMKEYLMTHPILKNGLISILRVHFLYFFLYSWGYGYNYLHHFLISRYMDLLQDQRSVLYLI